MTRAVTPPPTDFNFAQHLIATNAGRSAKTALIDDVGTLTYGELTEQIRRFAGGLKALGLKREERVLLLMQDSSDWVVAFLGSLYAGVVPVAVNTLLTAEDYAFMLSNSRAQAAIVSAALLPTLQTASSCSTSAARSPKVHRKKCRTTRKCAPPTSKPGTEHDRPGATLDRAQALLPAQFLPVPLPRTVSPGQSVGEPENAASVGAVAQGALARRGLQAA